jgi:putative FmdB family regulatory protein
MPTYEYYCEDCGNFEYFQNMSDPVLSSCPTCQKPVKRLISGGTGVIFKGSGFFNTDRRTQKDNETKNQNAKTEAVSKEAV